MKVHIVSAEATLPPRTLFLSFRSQNTWRPVRSARDSKSFSRKSEQLKRKDLNTLILEYMKETDTDTI